MAGQTLQGSPMRRLILAAVVVAIFLAGHQSAQLALAVSYAPGWNLISGPEGSTLTGASGSIYTLQPGDTDYQTFPADAKLKGGYGYWAYFPTGGQLKPTKSTNSYVATLLPGQWTMVGNPSLAQATLGGVDQAQTYSSSTGYVSVTVLDPGQGAWVLGVGAATITASGPEPLGLSFVGSVPLASVPRFGPTDRTVYEFHVAGLDLAASAGSDSLGIRIESSAGCNQIPGRGSIIQGSDQLFVAVNSNAPSGEYTVTLTAPDGRQVQATFMHTSSMAAATSAASQLSLTFIRHVPRNEASFTNPNNDAYEFRLIGVPLGPLSPPLCKLSVRSSAGSEVGSDGYGKADPDKFYVNLRPGTPSGSYVVTLTLYDGRSAQVTFSHSAGGVPPP